MTTYYRQEIEQLYVDVIQVGPGRRELSANAVTALMESIEKIGLRTPITIRSNDDTMAVLVAGAHRLEAVKRLGWEKIDCIVLDCNEVEAELWEIAENLHRADLSKVQRDGQIRRYAKLIAFRDPDLQSCQNDRIESKRADKRGHRPEGVASKVAKETGVSISTVRRALAVPTQSPRKTRQQVASPIQNVEPSELQREHETSAVWRSRLRELMGEIDIHLDRAPSPTDRAYGLKRLDGKWHALPAHNADGEIIEEPALAPSDAAVGQGGAMSGASSAASPSGEETADFSSPNLSQDPVLRTAPAEGVAAASACGEGTPATSSNISTDTEILTATGASMPGLPSFLDRRKHS